MDRLRLQRQARIPYILLLPVVLLLLTAGGASPLETQTATVGPYRLLLSFYSLPRAAQSLNMTIESATNDKQVQFSQATLMPGPGTDGNIVRVQITPDPDGQGVYDVSVTPPVRGLWYLHITVTGAAGSHAGNIPMQVQGPPAMPVWLGWIIGLTPLPFLMGFLWFQVSNRRRHHREMHLAN
jgi:hypothetical protein